MAILKKLKKGLKKAAKVAIPVGAALLAARAMKRKGEMKDFLATEGGDRSDMRDYGPFTKAPRKMPAKRSQSVLGQGPNKTNQVDYSGISDRIEDASAAKGGRIVKTKGGGKAVRGLGRAFTKRKK